MESPSTGSRRSQVQAADQSSSVPVFRPGSLPQTAAEVALRHRNRTRSRLLKYRYFFQPRHPPTNTALASTKTSSASGPLHFSPPDAARLFSPSPPLGLTLLTSLHLLLPDPSPLSPRRGLWVVGSFAGDWPWNLRTGHVPFPGSPSPVKRPQITEWRWIRTLRSWITPSGYHVSTVTPTATTTTSISSTEPPTSTTDTIFV